MFRRVTHGLSPAVSVSIAAGALYTLGLAVFALVVQQYEFIGDGPTALLIPIWTALGTFLVAAVPVYLLVRYSLALPFAVWWLNLLTLLRAELSPSPGDSLGVALRPWEARVCR